MKGSFGLFGIVPSSLNMVSCALRSRTACRADRADGRPMPVTVSSVFFRVSNRYMTGSPILQHQPACWIEVPPRLGSDHSHRLMTHRLQIMIYPRGGFDF